MYAGRKLLKKNPFSTTGWTSDTKHKLNFSDADDADEKREN